MRVQEEFRETKNLFKNPKLKKKNTIRQGVKKGVGCRSAIVEGGGGSQSLERGERKGGGFEISIVLGRRARTTSWEESVSFIVGGGERGGGEVA